MNQLRTLALLVSTAFASILPAVSQSHKEAAPCVSAMSNCTEWVLLNGGPARGLVYSTYSLAVPNPTIHRALIIVHGVLRNPDHYFRTATTAAFMAGALNNTIVIAPGFFSDGEHCKDKLERDQVNWGCEGDNFWRDGATSLTNKNLTSFDFVDEILRRLADKKNFPNLKAIVIAGHSAGGVFVTLYEMANRVGDTLGMPVS